MAEQAHGYYEWQVQTLMLAYDLVEPLRRGDEAAADARRERIELELRELVLPLLPPDVVQDPSRDIPPEVVMQMTRATLRRALDIAERGGGAFL